MSCRAVFFLLVLCGLAAPAAHAQDAAQTFSQANELFETSVAKLGRDDRTATTGLRQSATLYLSLVNDAGFNSSDLITNAANARLLAGETGQAIALYHRALRIDPADANARANLEVARSRASADASIRSNASIFEQLTSWRLALTPKTRAVIGAGTWAGIWLWAAYCVLFKAKPRLVAVPLPLAVVTIGMTLSFIADIMLRSAPPIGVVVVSETIGRTGPDAVVYDPSFTKPLPEGVEFTVIDQRTGWVLGRLADNRETWLPVADVTLVGT